MAILRALVAAPALLLADEPTAALDVSVSAAVLGLLHATAQSGVAIVVASHDRSSLEVLCDRVFEFEGSSLVRTLGRPVRHPRITRRESLLFTRRRYAASLIRPPGRQCRGTNQR